MDKYEPQKIEPKWQKYWEKHPELFSADDESSKKKSYILDMFPYPSGDGLHVGHVESYTATDIVSRYLRMNGKNVLHPTGWDAFGLPAENYAIKTKIHPAITTQKAITTFKGQMKKLSLSYDWSREVNSSDPDYYKWTQWFFLLLYKNGLAYRAKAKVNYCLKCQTVLANEQVISGKCERCETEVVQKDLEQWFFKITDFIEDSADKSRLTRGLLSGLDKVDWPESTKAAQKNWIGRSAGAQFKMCVIPASEPESNEILNQVQDDMFIEVYTTRLDTVFGMTYAVVAPEHKIVTSLLKISAKGGSASGGKNQKPASPAGGSKIKNIEEIKKYVIQSQNKTELERMEMKNKTGVEIKGLKAINPFTNEEVPIFVADYVLGHYGTGAVMAVPAHDERDFEFAKKYNLPIKQSIAPLLVVKEGNDAVRDNKPTVRRKTIVAILKHWKKDEIFCLHWEKFGWKSFIIGGIKENESAEQAAIREAKEESGYQNIKSVRKISGEVHSNFYAAHKNENRYAETECYYIELGSDEYKAPEEKDIKNHKGKWVSRDKVCNYVNLNIHGWYCNVFSKGESAFVDDGVLVNSEKYSGMTSEKAREEMAKWLEENNLGSRKINYKLRDWLISRQRYWGVPIPIIYCKKCGIVPIPEKDLPVELPDDVDFNPTGESPLIHSKKFHNVKCPKCGAKARRESDTMDTFVCSSWYYFRYTDPKNTKVFADKEKIKKWLPVNLYVGGAEHTVLHLLYSRFFTKALHKLGYIDFDEPFLKLRHQGTILGEDNYKMSKSRGNIVNPDDVINQYGADALRMFEMFMGPLEDAKPWNTKGIIGLKRFLEKIWRLQESVIASEAKQSRDNNSEIVASPSAPRNDKIKKLLHKTIKKVTEDIGNFRFNTAISQMMILVNEMEKEHAKSATANAPIRIKDFEKLLIILSPFAPHISEELWEKLGHKESVFRERWPEYDPKLIKDEEIDLVIQVNGRVRDTIKVSADISEDEAKELALKSEKVKKFTEGKDIKKTIFVKGKLINLVA